jgi:arginine:pyruvate transaminase
MQQMLIAFRFMGKGLHQNRRFWKDKSRSGRIFAETHARFIKSSDRSSKEHSFDLGVTSLPSEPMSRFSKRIETLTGGGSDGWDIYRKSQKLIRAGHSVIELTIGDHDRKTDPSILNAMYEAAKAGHTGYASIPGTDALRERVAKRTERITGVRTSRDNVVITAGGQAALFLSHAIVCDPGDTALFIDPYYATYPGTIRGTGAVAQAVTAKADAGFQPKRSDLELADPARSLLINSPNNPTGVVYGADTLSDIASFVTDRDMWLISDEVYDTQLWDGTHLSPRTLPGMGERTLVVGSLSKSHAMTGSRIGWVVGPKDAIDHAIKLSTHTTYGLPGYLQDAGVFALDKGPKFEASISAPFRRRHSALGGIFATRGMAVVPSTATMYLMLDVRATGLSGDDFADRLLDACLIAVMPGESFGQAAAGHIRVALTTDDAALEQAAHMICDFYETLTKDAA